MSDLEQQVVAYAQTASAGLRATQQESDPFTFTKEEEAEFSHQRQLQEATSGEIVQPNENGEFPTPADGAIWMAATFGIPQTPLKGKKPFLPGWQLNGSTDPAQIREWTTEYPECNFGSVAVSGKHFIFEADSTAVRERFKTQNPDHDFTSRLIIESSPGKGHRYYLSAPGVENVGQNKGDDFSIRADGEQCVSPGSIHPVTGRQYRVAAHNGQLVRPTPEEILYWKKERADKKTVPAQLHTDELILEGKRNSTITSILGRARQQNALEYDALLALARQHNQRCTPLLPESELETIAGSIAKYPVKPSGPETVILGGVVGGNEKGAAAPTSVDWRTQFKSVDELEEGEVQMLIDSFLPEGTTFIGGLPGEGKTFLALSIARALTTGKPFLGKFPIQKKVPVVYLIPESGGRTFRKRCKTFEIPDDPNLFLCRTVSEGSTLPLDNESVLEAVRRLKPVVVLDTIIRFSEAQDENQAMQNKKLVDDVIRLRQNGAVAVIGLHHATKAMRDKGMSLETALRGTGDIAASADAVYGMLRDDKLYDNNRGPNEIDVACLKARDFDAPQPLRVAASQKPAVGTGGLTIGMESVINENHDFKMVSRLVQSEGFSTRIEQAIIQTKTLGLKDLAEMTGSTIWQVRQTLDKLGYTRKQGRGGSGWVKRDLSTIRVGDKEGGKDAFIDLDARAAA